MSAIKVQVFRGRHRLRQSWRFRIRSANGRILASSEAYSNLQDCIDAAEQVAAPLTLELPHD